MVQWKMGSGPGRCVNFQSPNGLVIPLNHDYGRIRVNPPVKMGWVGGSFDAGGPNLAELISKSCLFPFLEGA